MSSNDMKNGEEAARVTSPDYHQEVEIVLTMHRTARAKLVCKAIMFIATLAFTFALFRFSGSVWCFLALLLLLTI